MLEFDDQTTLFCFNRRLSTHLRASRLSKAEQEPELTASQIHFLTTTYITPRLRPPQTISVGIHMPSLQRNVPSNNVAWSFGPNNLRSSE
jgi:hypothetical protein